MISGLKGAGVKDLMQFLMDQVCSYKKWCFFFVHSK